MNILIIEDEKPAAEQLMRLLHKEEPNAFFHGPIASIKASKEWLAKNPSPDLIFLDIHLSDGPGFEIFNEKTELSSPVIFCTAYDQYALKAFQTQQY
ncbi:MAG: response regulator [Owenweeksia sp.]|nr:response regulator [Owenweeksia sp.]